MGMIYLKDVFTKNIDFLISSYIREYDISKANISILLSKGLISKYEYDYYCNLDKSVREITIGNLQKNDTKIKIGLNNGFGEYRQMFFEANNLNEDDILSIRKDAIYVIDKIPKYTKFDMVDFVNKNTYTSFYKINNIELYYRIDTIKNIEYLDCKGMKKVLNLHDNYMNEFFKCVFECAENSFIEETIYIVSNFLDNYINMNLESNYYREYNSISRFKIMSTPYSIFYSDILTPNMTGIIDINYNRKIIELLLSYYSRIYLN